MNVGVSVKNQMIGVLAKIIICGILVHVIASVVKLMNIQIVKHIIDKLVLECEDEMLNTTGTPRDDKEKTCK